MDPFYLKLRNFTYKGSKESVLYKNIEIKNEKIEKLEAIALNIFLKNENFLFLTYYNPPQHQIDSEMIQELTEQYPLMVICGDLNAESEIMGCSCRVTNNNGKQLKDLVIESNLIVANDHQLTYQRIYFNSFDILDYVITK